MAVIEERRSGQDLIEDQIISTLEQWPNIPISMLTANVAPYSRNYAINWRDVLQNLIALGIVTTSTVERNTRSVTVYRVDPRNKHKLYESSE